MQVAKVIDQNALNRDTLTSAVKEIIASDSFRRSSAEISRGARTLNAVPLACNIIEKLAQEN
jgi:UDP:flavonoid glycosyltransferase YjiC (YdhE family)